MNKMQEQVAEFHKAFGVPVNQTPQLINRERAMLRAKLIFEEAQETLSAMAIWLGTVTGNENQIVPLYTSEEPNIIEIADGLADLLYVTFGACLEFGIDIQAVFDCVHESNMSKMWNEAEIHEHIYHVFLPPLEQYKDCTVERVDVNSFKCFVIKRKDGKILKSPSYKPADIKSVLEKLKGK